MVIKMKIVTSLFISTIAGCATLLGGFLSYINITKEKRNKFITLCLSFSLAIMLSLSVFELIPETFITLLKNYKLMTTNLIIIAIFFIGVGAILLLNKIITKFSKNESNLYKLGILNMIALMAHNLPEGIATFMSSYNNINLGIKIAIAIMLHNIPEGISIAVPIYYATKNRKKALMMTAISSLAEPLGAILCYIFLKHYINDISIAIILTLVAGIMVTLSIHELLPEAKKYNEEKYLKFGIIVGVLLMFINIFLL